MSSCSGMLAENLVQLSIDNPMRRWYEGMTLLDTIDTFKNPTRPLNKPLRAIITAVLKESKSMCNVSVKVLQGQMTKERGVGIGSHSFGLVQEGNEGDPSDQGLPFVADVKRMFIDDGVATSILCAGQNGTISLQVRGGISGEKMYLKEGLVLYKGPPILRKCKKFRATIQTFSNLAIPIITGSIFDLYLHGEEIQCFIKKIYSVTLKKRKFDDPKCISASSFAMVKIKMERHAFVEVFDDCSSLGRFALRTRGVTSAVGICVRCYFPKSIEYLQ